MKIRYTNQAFLDILQYIKYNEEISGFGKTSIDEDGTILVEKVVILKQKCGPATTIIEPEDIMKFLGNLPEEEDIENWNLWWHSHVNMAASFSGKDYETMEELAKMTPNLLAIVVNKKYEQEVAINVQFKNGIILNKVIEGEKIMTLQTDDSKKEEIEKLVSKDTQHTVSGKNYYPPDPNQYPTYGYNMHKNPLEKEESLYTKFCTDCGMKFQTIFKDEKICDSCDDIRWEKEYGTGYDHKVIQ